MLKIRKLLILYLLVIVFTSCQATPEIDYVVPKGEGNFEQALNTQAPQYKMYEAPTIWVEEYPLEFLTFYFDTPVHVPSIESFPVFSMQQRTLSKVDIEAFISPFISNATKYAEPVATKAYYDQEIVITKRGYFDTEKNMFVKHPNEKEMIRELEQLRQNAPEHPDYKAIDMFQIKEIPFGLEFYYDGQESAQISASNNSITINKLHECIIQPESWVKAGNAIWGEPKGSLLENVKISETDALEQAKSILSRAGIDYLSLIRAEKARLVDSWDKVVSEGWKLNFGRGDAGYKPVDLYAYTDNIYRTSQAGPEYSAAWDLEYMEMYIDDGGLLWMNWDNILETSETITENVSLLNFNEVQSRVKQQLKNEWSWVESKDEYDILDQTVVDITLSYSLLPAKDDTTKTILAPTWYIFYTMSDYADEVGSVQPFLLAINAVDGSKVNPIAPKDFSGVIEIDPEPF